MLVYILVKPNYRVTYIYIYIYILCIVCIVVTTVFRGEKKFAGCVVPHFVNVSCSYYTRVFNNSNSLLSPANRHLCLDTSGALHVYIKRPLRAFTSCRAFQK
uniref:Uncharacterized protein n=1 Tax=Schizaphis graminum TaxID=13262 RepID=A0A2S2NE50_SCHGA